jgi:hypothetical protein
MLKTLASAFCALLILSAAQAATAATLSATFNNSTTKSQTRAAANGWAGTPSNIPNPSMSSGSTTNGQASSTGNIVASARYVDTTNVGCSFTATASKGVDGRYSFSRSATPFGSSGGRTATCAATITSSTTATGNFNVTFTTSGF